MPGYKSAMQQARTYLDGQDYTNALAQVQTALSLKPDDAAALDLQRQVQEKLRQWALSQQNDQAFGAAMQAAQTALAGADYATSIAQAMAALAIKPNDPTAQDLLTKAQRLQTDAENGKKTAQALAEQEAKYQAAVTASRTALADKKYDEALTQAKAAQAIKAGDETALRLQTEAENGKKAEQALAEQERTYQAAVTASRAALADKKYDEALTQAKAALAIKPGDETALRLQTEAENGKKTEQ